ncbi:MAG TPA: flagellar biosynthetic protein FliO [Tepidisphaeraceae bacterium]|jgi:flagellar biogenesis protein FliO
MPDPRPIHRLLVPACAVAFVLLLATGALAEHALPAATRSTVRDPLSDLPSYGESLKRMVISLLVIIAGLLIAARFLPRILLGRAGGRKSAAAGASGQMIDVIETCRIEPRKTIYLVRVGEQYYLLASTGDRLETLAGGPLDSAKLSTSLRAAAAIAEQESAAPTRPARSFADLLKGKRLPDRSRPPAA